MTMKAFFVMSVVAQATAFGCASMPHPIASTRPIALHSTKKSAQPLLSKTSLTALSSASTGGLLLRGGAAAADAVALKNFYGDALGFFGGIRIPASFLAGSSLAAIFTLKNAANDLSASSKDGRVSTTERRAIKCYHLTSVLAFLLSLNTLMTAQSAYTSILHGRFDHMAETAYMLMKREFEYEFVSVRWSFFTSLFMFLSMVASRVLIDFGLLKCDGDGKKPRKDVAMLVVFSIGSLAANLLSYVNSTLWCWRSLFGMTVYLAQLVLKRAFVERRPLQVVSVVCTMASTFLIGKLALKDLNEGTKEE